MGFANHFKTKEKSITIKALDGEEFKIRSLSVAQKAEVQALVMKGDHVTATVKAACFGVISEVLDFKEVMDLPQESFRAIDEIAAAIMELDTPKK